MDIKDKIWWTRKAKIEQESRLLRYEFHSQALLIWYSFFTVAISILQLSNTDIPLATSTLVIFSVLTLVMSGIVSAQKFHSRSEKVKSCYEQLNTLMFKNDENNALQYETILKSCENHTSTDHHISKVKAYWQTQKKERNEKIKPPLTLNNFIEAFISKLKYYLTIIFLYTLPFSSALTMRHFIE